MSTLENGKLTNNQDSELSNRERRKLVRKSYFESKRGNSHHDENGYSGNSEKINCDCLREECPGCHFPCPKCRSCKCGVECRTNRKSHIDMVEIEGANSTLKSTCLSLHL